MHGLKPLLANLHDVVNVEKENTGAGGQSVMEVLLYGRARFKTQSRKTHTHTHTV